MYYFSSCSRSGLFDFWVGTNESTGPTQSVTVKADLSDYESLGLRWTILANRFQIKTVVRRLTMNGACKFPSLDDFTFLFSRLEDVRLIA